MFRLNRVSRVGLRIVALLGFVGLVSLSGCSGGTGSLSQVEGKVTVDNAPLTDGEVTFIPATETTKKGLTIKGTIGADGSYKMQTNGKDGVPAGKYKVTVNTMVVKPPAPGGSPIGSGPPVAQAPPQRKAAAKFENPAETPLAVEVPGGNYNLALTLN